MTTHNISVWNRDDLYKRVRGKRERAEKLISMFLGESSNRIDRLKTHYQSSDLEGCARVAHEIKGVSGNLGGDELYKLMKSVEEAANSSAMETLGELIQLAESANQRLERVLQEELNSPS